MISFFDTLNYEEQIQVEEILPGKWLRGSIGNSNHH